MAKDFQGTPTSYAGINKGMMDAPLFQKPGESEPPAPPGTDEGGGKGRGGKGKRGGGKGGGKEGGKRKFQFFCELCNAKTTGEENFKVHLNGTRHLTNLKNKESGEPLITEKINYPNLKARKVDGDIPEQAALRDKIAASEDPLVGIEYLLEFVRDGSPDDVYYVCEMCKCRLSGGSVIPHLIGTRHGSAYVKKHFPDMAKGLDRKPESGGKGGEGLKRSNVSTTLKDITREIERIQGRQVMKTTLVPNNKPGPNQVLLNPDQGPPPGRQQGRPLNLLDMPARNHGGPPGRRGPPGRGPPAGPPNLLEMQFEDHHPGVPEMPEYDREHEFGPRGPDMDMHPGMMHERERDWRERELDEREAMRERNEAMREREEMIVRREVQRRQDERLLEERRMEHHGTPERDFGRGDRLGRGGSIGREFDRGGSIGREFDRGGSIGREFDRGPMRHPADIDDPEMRGPGIHRPDMHDSPEIRGPERRGPEMRGREMHGPEMRGPEMRGPEMRGPEMQGPEVHGPGPEMRGPEMRDIEFGGPGGTPGMDRAQRMGGGPGIEESPGMGRAVGFGGGPGMVEGPGMGGAPGMGGMAGMGGGSAMGGPVGQGMGMGMGGAAGMGVDPGMNGSQGMGVNNQMMNTNQSMGVTQVMGGGQAGAGMMGAQGLQGGMDALAWQQQQLQQMQQLQQQQQYPGYDQTGMYQNTATSTYDSSNVTAAQMGLGMVSSATGGQLGAYSASTWAQAAMPAAAAQAAAKKKSLDDYMREAATEKKAAKPAKKARTVDTEEDLQLKCSDAFILHECERRFKKRINPRDGHVASIDADGKVIPEKPSAAIPSLDTNTVKNLLTELSQSMVKNEEDAAMALQVSNALTQALLNYRIKHMPNEMT